MDVSHLLQQLQPIGLPAYALSDQVGSVEPMVKLFAWSLRLYVFTKQPDHVAHDKFSGLRTSIGVLPMRSPSLFSALL